MSIEPGILPPGPQPGIVNCAIHGPMPFKDGCCAACAAAIENHDMVSCPEHGLVDKNERWGDACPKCEGRPPAPNPTYGEQPDIPAVGVSPKPMAKPIKKAE